MTAKHGTAVQISTYPPDVRHFQHLLSHHLRAWGDSVDRIVVTIDTHRSQAGRFHSSNFEQSFTKLRQLLAQARATYPRLEVVEVDYSEATRRAVTQYFFGLDSMPAKAWNGEYFYSLFFGLHVADARYVLHFDSDMLFGGGSRAWVREAIACLDERPDVLLVAPFPGPPRTDGSIFGQESWVGGYSRENLPQPAYRYMHASSRVFMIDLDRFKSRLGVLPLIPTNAVQKLKGKLLGNPSQAIGAELLLSRTMQRSGLYRIDMLGSQPGMWSLHPPYRSDEFYRRLPEIIRAVESGDVPDAQRGEFDLNDSMIDWTGARVANTRYRRYMRIVRQRLSRAVQPGISRR